MVHLIVLIAGASLLLNRRIRYVLIAYVVLAVTESVFVASSAFVTPLTLALFALATAIKVVLAPAGIALFVRANPAADDLRPSLSMPLRLLLVIGFAIVSATVARFPALGAAGAGSPADLIAYVLLCGVGMLIVHRNLLSHIIGLLVLGVAIAIAGAVLAPALPEAIELGATFDALVATFIGLAIAGRRRSAARRRSAEPVTRMIALAVVAPFAAALLTLAVRDHDRRRIVRIALATVAAACALGAAGSVDLLARIFLTIVSLLGLLATIVSAGSFSVDWVTGEAIWSRKPVYFLLLGAFWSSMLLVVLAGNFATLWLGISATTLVTAFLVGFGAERAALEAAWKYLVLCSVGIGFALLGIIALAHVSLANGLPPASALAWDAIVAHAPATAPPLARLAIAVMLLGFATKAGLVPMHAWLPDAHSKAPAPISALLSGVLVSCALYAIVRTLAVADALGAGPLAHGVLLALGAASTIVAGSLMLAQRDLKRLLAYSTVEHAGIVALALGFGGPIGAFAALFHVASHAFVKSGAFFAAGMVQHERRTTDLGTLHGLWRSGAGGRCLLAALTALAGLPPFGLFVSELLLILAGVAAHQWAALAAGLTGIALAFAALARTAIETESGDRPRIAAFVARRTSRLALSATGVTLAAALVLAVSPWTPALARAYAAAVSAAGAMR